MSAAPGRPKQARTAARKGEGTSVSAAARQVGGAQVHATVLRCRHVCQRKVPSRSHRHRCERHGRGARRQIQQTVAHL